MARASRALRQVQWRLRVVPPVAWGALVAAVAGGVLVSAAGQSSPAAAVAIPLAFGVILLYLSRHYLEVAVVITTAAIFLDFYQIVAPPLHEPVIWLLLAAALVAVMFLAQSHTWLWVRVPHLWLWMLLLVVAGLAVPRGQLTATASYYVTVFINGLLMYVIGVQVVRGGGDLRRLLGALATLSAFIAAHSIVQGLTGQFLFATQHLQDYLGSKAGFHLAGTTVNRAGSFFQNPDWNGAFLAMMLFVPLGMATSAQSRAGRAVFVAFCVLDVLGLLFTFSAAAWVAAVCGVLLYVAVFVPRRYRAGALAAIGSLLAAIAIVFSVQVRLLLAHASAQNEYTLRLGAWLTALRAIGAHPLTGLGMAQTIYLNASKPYRVAWETTLLAHPHNSYLELAAFAGLPVLAAFLALLAAELRTALATYRAAPPEVRPLIGGVLAAQCTFCVNSIAINGWTLPVLAALGWLLLGAISSPLLRSVQPRVLAEGSWASYRVPEAAQELQVQNQVAPGPDRQR